MFIFHRLTLGILGIVLISSVGVFFIYQHRQKKNSLPEHIQKHQKINTKKADFTVYDLSRRSITLNSLKNNVVMINFWATWCAPCVEELPSLDNLAKHFPEKLVILAVSNERSDTIKNFLMAFPDFHPNFIPANVGRSEMLATFSVRAFPETYILDKTGQLVQKIIGPQKWDSPEWKNKIKKLIKDQSK